jgi:hypothetical protein
MLNQVHLALAAIISDKKKFFINIYLLTFEMTVLPIETMYFTNSHEATNGTLS